MDALRITFLVALYAHACFFLGIAGQLRAIPLLVLTVVFAVAAVWRFRFPVPRVAWLFFAPLFVLALYPPVAFDETLYRLPFVQTFARHGALVFATDLRFPVFPVLHELLCVPVFLLAGDIAPHFVSVIEVILIAALLVAWDARAGWLATALFLGSPLVVMLATTLHAEVALTLFIVAGFLALDRERYALAGFFLGSACSVKYLGFYFAAAALVFLIVRRRGVAMYALACALAALPMTLWIFMQSGDPLFPFLTTNPWNIASPSTSVSIADRALLIWNVTFARDRVGMQPPVTPFLALLVIALVVAAWKRDGFARGVLLLSAGYVVAFNFLPQDARYLVPLLPFVCLGAAMFVASRWARLVPLLTILAISPAIAYAGYRVAKQGVPPVDREVWLAEQIPEYRALRVAGTAPVFACLAERLKAHARGRYLGDHNGLYSYDRIHVETMRILADKLRRIGVRYYLVSKRACPPPIDDGGMELVYEDTAAQLWRVPTK